MKGKSHPPFRESIFACVCGALGGSLMQSDEGKGWVGGSSTELTSTPKMKAYSVLRVFTNDSHPLLLIQLDGFENLLRQ